MEVSEFKSVVEALLEADAMAVKGRARKPETYESIQRGYRSVIRSSIRGLWNGSTSFDQFYEDMMWAIDTAFDAVWRVAARGCGIADDEWTFAEKAELERMKVREYEHIEALAARVEEGSKENKGRLRDALKTVGLWIQRLRSVYDRAQSLACGDKKLEWVRHAKDSCASCRALDGKVYRASIWAKYGLYPNCDKLECVQDAGGVPVCRCDLRPTTKPGSKGKVPLT